MASEIVAGHVEFSYNKRGETRILPATKPIYAYLWKDEPVVEFGRLVFGSILDQKVW